MATQGAPTGAQSQYRRFLFEFSEKLKEFPHFGSFMTAAAHAAASSVTLDCAQLLPAHTRLPQYALLLTFTWVEPAFRDSICSESGREAKAPTRTRPEQTRRATARIAASYMCASRGRVVEVGRLGYLGSFVCLPP